MRKNGVGLADAFCCRHRRRRCGSERMPQCRPLSHTHNPTYNKYVLCASDVCIIFVFALWVCVCLFIYCPLISFFAAALYIVVQKKKQSNKILITTPTTTAMTKRVVRRRWRRGFFYSYCSLTLRFLSCRRRESRFFLRASLAFVSASLHVWSSLLRPPRTPPFIVWDFRFCKLIRTPHV